MERTNGELGKLGEALAVSYLVQEGYTIRRRNYRFRRAELDIIAATGELLVVVEVRSRRSDRLQRIAETISPAKIRHIVEATNRYMQVRELELEVRFDIITVHFGGPSPVLTHITDAFYHF